MLDYEDDADNNRILECNLLVSFAKMPFLCRTPSAAIKIITLLTLIYDHDLSAFYSIFHPWWDGILNLRDADKYRLSIARTKNAFWVVIRAATGVLPNIDRKSA